MRPCTCVPALLLVVLLTACESPTADEYLTPSSLTGEAMGSYYRVTYLGGRVEGLQESIDSLLEAYNQELSILKRENIGAINWGLVAGKSNTIYAWNTPIEDGSEPDEWFHDVFRKDGTPYRRDEADLITELNGEED